MHHLRIRLRLAVCVISSNISLTTTVALPSQNGGVLIALHGGVIIRT